MTGSEWRASATSAPGKPTIQRPRRERGDGRGFDRTVERLVVVAEALVVRTVPRLVDVEQRDDETGLFGIATHAAGGLNVLRVGLGLPVDHHQAEPGNVKAHGDHVGRQRAVDMTGFVEATAKTLERGRHLVGRPPER